MSVPIVVMVAGWVGSRSDAGLNDVSMTGAFSCTVVVAVGGTSQFGGRRSPIRDALDLVSQHLSGDDG